MAKFAQADAVHVRISCGCGLPGCARAHACARVLVLHALACQVRRSAVQAGILKPPLPHVCMEIVDMESQLWTEGLNPCGLYYEGYTDDLQLMLTKHSTATVSMYGVRRSHTNHVAKSIAKKI